MRKEKGGKRGKKKMDERQEEREKESGEVEERIEERTEEGTEEGTQETEERLELTEEACEEEERCEEDLESHSAAKRARVCSTFTDSQETAIVEFVKEHPELYDKEHVRFPLMSEDGSNPSERVMGSCQNYNLAKPQGRRPRDSPGSTSRWVSLRPISDERGPAEVQGSRPVQIPASRTNLVGLLLIQNTSSPVSSGRVGGNLCSHLHQFQQTPRYSSTLTR